MGAQSSTKMRPWLLGERRACKGEPREKSFACTMEYSLEDRERIVSELNLLDRDAKSLPLGYFHRAPACAPRLPLHRPLQVTDLHLVDWSVFAPEVPQCERTEEEAELEWYECTCRHCQVHATPRTVCRLVQALIFARNYYNRLCRLPVLTCLYDYFKCNEQTPTPGTIAARWGRAQQHVLQLRHSWQAAFTEYRDDLPYAEDPSTGHELVCDWKLQPMDKTFLNETVGDTWLYATEDYLEECPDELHEEFCREYAHNGSFWLPLPRFLREWRHLHPRGYRRWRRLLLDSFDLLIMRILTQPDVCCSGSLATCVMEEMAVGLAAYHLDHAVETPHSTDLLGHEAVGQALLASLPVCVWDHDLHTSDPGWCLLERVLQDVDFLFLWPYWPGSNEDGRWPPVHKKCSLDVHPELHNPEVGRMRFPLDFLVPFGNEPSRLQQQQLQWPLVPRMHLAALRIHRFWRDVCSNPQYVHARRCLAYMMESDEPIVLGKRLRDT